MIATLVVLGGVFGEAGATGEVASINSDLRSKASELRAKGDQLLAVITEEAGDAATSAKTAQDELDVVSKEVGDVTNQAKNLRRLQNEAEEAQFQIAERQFDRKLDSTNFVKSLIGKPKARVKIWYNPNDHEAWDLAQEIYMWLGKGPSKNDVAAGWDVSQPEPLSINASGDSTLANAPPAVRFGASGSTSGIGFIAKDISLQTQDSPLSALTNALPSNVWPTNQSRLKIAGKWRTVRSTSSMALQDETLPDDFIIVIVGPKPTWRWGLDQWDKENKKNNNASTK